MLAPKQVLAAAVGLLVTSALALPAAAQSVRVLGEHNSWSAYATTEGSGQICFVLSRPTATEPQPQDFSEGYFYITHRPAETVRSEINIVAGYQMAPDSEATLSIGGQDFALFTQDDAAWLADPSQSSNAVQAIRAGSTMTVEGVAASGETVTQRFSLSGATAATNAIDSAC